MIRDTTAQRIASEWHSGQSSALYALASTGAIRGVCNDWEQDLDAYEEITATMLDADTETEHRDLKRLLDYVMHHGPRPAVPDWYNRVIRKADR